MRLWLERDFWGLFADTRTSRTLIKLLDQGHSSDNVTCITLILISGDVHIVLEQLFVPCRVSCVKIITTRRIASSVDAVYSTDETRYKQLYRHIYTYNMFIWHFYRAIMGNTVIHVFHYYIHFLTKDILIFKIIIYGKDSGYVMSQFSI
jgi:hypothetical protein